MTVGIPNAGQVNALGTINIRGERSVTCKGDLDTAPGKGPLPAGAPPVCEEFRKQPDAMERAAELDAAYGRTPDLAAMPMYCIPFSFKDPFDTKDIRSTGSADAATTSIPGSRPRARGSARKKGAIIYTKSVLTEEDRLVAGNRAADTSRSGVSTEGFQRARGRQPSIHATTRAASASARALAWPSAQSVMPGCTEESGPPAAARPTTIRTR
jgi:hypothetical protein